MNYLRRLCASVLQAILACVAVQAGTVTGVVTNTDGFGQPVANARVTLFAPSPFYFTEARTDSDGSYVLSSIPTGNYLLGVSARGFEYQEQSQTVTAGSNDVQDFGLGAESHVGQWSVIGTTAPEFLDATDIGILLPDGRIFYCHDTTDPILFDPVTGTRSFPPGSPTPQGCQHATLLNDGQVIMMGGQSPADPGSFRDAVPWTKRWNPASQTWQLMADMQHALGRWYPGLARLADGSLLVMGGGTCCQAVRTDTSERFDPVAETWSYTGSMLNPTEFPPAALLYTGEVLSTWWPPQLYDPATGTWRATGNFNQPNRFWPGHSDHSLVVLADGRVLALGVVSGPDGNTNMGEVYDPATENWSLIADPNLVRFQSEVVQLPDGRVFVGGGETEVASPPVSDVLGIVPWCDLYDPATDEWRRVADMTWHREYHAVTLLIPDGRIVTTGGTRIKFQAGPTSADIEAFSPPYLFRGVRPEIASVSANDLPRGGQITVELAFETALSSIVLLGLQTTTHWVDGGIPRRMELSVQQTGTTVTAVLPSNPNVAMLGHYMLFAMVDDIPSVARVIRVVAGQGNCDGDADQDLRDFAVFQQCFGRSDLALDSPCHCADLDGSGTVDSVDFQRFTSNMAGPFN